LSPHRVFAILLGMGESAPRAPAPGGGGRSRLGRLLRHLNVLVLLVVVYMAAAMLLRPADDDALLGLPDLEVGDIAPRTIRAPRAFEIRDEDTERRLRQEAQERVRPVHDFLPFTGIEARARLEQAFAAMGVDVVPPKPRPSRDDFMRALLVSFPEGELEAIAKVGFGDEFRDAALMVVGDLFEQRIVEDRALFELQAPGGILVRVWSPDRSGVEREESIFDPKDVLALDQARARVDELVSTRLGHLDPKTRRAVAVVAKRLLRPNLEPNPAETERRRRAAELAVKPRYVRFSAGEIVLHERELVGPRDRLALDAMAADYRSERRLFSKLGGAALFVLLTALVTVFHGRASPRFLPGKRDLALCAATYVGLMLSFWLSHKGAIWAGDRLPGVDAEGYRALAPVAWGALLLRFVLGPRVAAAFVPVAALTAGWVMDRSLGYAVYALVGGAVAAMFTPGIRPRSQLLQAGFWAGMAQAGVSLLLAAEAADLGQHHLDVLIAALASGLLSAIVVLVVVPPVEVLFGYTTALKLTDLTNLNHPLLRELLVKAPGTYHHSIVVGAMAEAGARAIDADALLARAGGYYHDVGKLKSPGAYRENRRGRAGRAVEPNVDLRGHVAEGIEIGARHRLGRALLDIVAQHHGTSPVRASGLREGSVPDLDPRALRYAGTRPLGREAALVMLADFVEAAVSARVAEAPLEEGGLEPLVHGVIDEVARDGQLDASNLRFVDLRRIGDRFAAVLREVLLTRVRPPTPVEPVEALAVVVRPPFGGPPN
jgi:putative nucleotidyltransferase with HDIG domain